MPQLVSEEKPFVALASSLERAGRVEDLIQLYEARSNDVLAPTEAAALLAKAAELARTKMKNVKRAEGLLRRAHGVAPEDAAPLRALLELYEHTQDHAAVAETLEGLASRSKGARRQRCSPAPPRSMS